MVVLTHADERTQMPLGAGSLPEAGTPDGHFLDGGARQAVDDRVALFAKGVRWRERAERLEPRAALAAGALQGSGDA